MITVYGLKNCDTCRKALAWLGEQKIAHRVVDLRADGISREEIARFVKTVGAEKLVNKASTTWRGLPDEVKDVSTDAKVVDLLAANPTLIKRPVFDAGKTVVVGFRDAEKAAVRAMAK